MNHMRRLIYFLQHWNAIFPLLCALFAMTLHNSLIWSNTLYILIVVVAVGAVFTVAPFMQLVQTTLYAPIWLGLLYTVVPYLFGLLNLGLLPTATDRMWMLSLFLLSAGTMALSGFRKKTPKKAPPASAFIARVGTDGACFISLIAVLAGSVLAIWQVHNALWLVTMVALLLGALAFCIVQLADTQQSDAARTAIVAIDTIQYGIIITLLAAYFMFSHHAGTLVVAGVCGILTALFLMFFFEFVGRPQPAKRA